MILIQFVQPRLCVYIRYGYPRGQAEIAFGERVATGAIGELILTDRLFLSGLS
jgi:hypothetical protein